MATCLMCGSSLPPDASVCPTCQTPVEPETSPSPPERASSPPEVPVRRSNARPYGILLGVLAAIAILVLLLKFGRAYLPAREPETLIPKSMAFSMEVSVPDLWKTVAPFIRESADASQELKEFETRTRLSVERDILPAFGSHAAIAMDMSGAMAGKLGMVGVFPIGRHVSKAYSVLKTLQAEAMKTSGSSKAHAHRYGGVRYWTQDAQSPAGAMSYGFLRRCIVITSDESMMKKVIDVALGRLHSITDVSGYAKVKRALPQQYVARVSYNFKELIASMPMPIPMSEKQKQAMNVIGGYGVTIQLPQGRILMTIAASMSETKEGREYLAVMKKYKAMTGDTYPYLPPDPLVLSTSSNLSESYKQMVKYYDPGMFMFMPPNFKAAFEKIGQYVPKAELPGLLATLTGESSFALSGKPDKKQIEFMLVSLAANEQSLRAALDKLDSGFAKRGLRVERKVVANAMCRTLVPPSASRPLLTYAQWGNVLLVANNADVVAGCIQRKQSGGASSASNKDVMSLRNQMGKDSLSFTFCDFRKIKDIVASLVPGPDRDKVAVAVDRLGVMGSARSLGNDIYLASLMTSSTLKDCVDSMWVVAGVMRQMTMQRMTGRPRVSSATPVPSPEIYGGSSPASGRDPFTAAMEKSRQASCQSNLKQLSLGMLMYVQDYDDKFPPTRQWNKALYPYIKNRQLLTCPAAPGLQYGYAMNSRLDRISLTQVVHPNDVSLLFDSSAGKANAADAGSSWCQPPRHLWGNNSAFVDGHVKLLSQPPNFDPKK